jgi:hypothetical protein
MFPKNWQRKRVRKNDGLVQQLVYRTMQGDAVRRFAWLAGLHQVEWRGGH